HLVKAGRPTVPSVERTIEVNCAASAHTSVRGKCFRVAQFSPGRHLDWTSSTRRQAYSATTLANTNKNNRAAEGTKATTGIGAAG
uniref:Uncharacterized protein n=1 Tax=Anopheles quadriannulatus TaxID=34691 RepID=A0A182XEN1_ANOQN